MGAGFNGSDFIGLELLIQCDSCGSTQPVNRPEQKTKCSNCLAQATVDAEAWRVALTTCVDDIGKRGRGVMKGDALSRAGRNVEWERGPDRPRCAKCDGATSVEGDDAYVCDDCGERATVEPVPDFLRAACSDVIGFVCQAETASADKPKKIGMTCNGCGASLTTMGETRTVECDHCHTANLLPDDVWRALHPAKKRQRFWLLCRLSPDVRRVPRSLGRESITTLAMVAFVAGFVSLFLGGITGSIVLGKNKLNGDEFLPYAFRYFVVIWGIVALLVARSWFVGRRIIKHEYEVVGRLGPFTKGRSKVELFEPGKSGARIGAANVPVSEARHQELGGEGGVIRAWALPNRKKAICQAKPSGLA